MCWVKKAFPKQDLILILMCPCSSIIDQENVLEAVASRYDRCVVDTPGLKYARLRAMQLMFSEAEAFFGGNGDLPAEAFVCGVPATKLIGGAWYTMPVSSRTPSSSTAIRTV